MDGPLPHPRLSEGLDPPLGGEEEEESDRVVAYVTPPQSFSSFLPLPTPFVSHAGYRAGTYVPHSVLSASPENITTRLHMKGCRGVHNLCVGVGLFYQTSSSPQLQLR